MPRFFVKEKQAFLAQRKPFLRDARPKIFGYERLSNSLELSAGHFEAFKQFGCSKIFQDALNGSIEPNERPQLKLALDALEKGDVLVVPKLNRLGYTKLEVLTFIHQSQLKGISIRTLDGLFDTDNFDGQFGMVVVFLRALAEFDKSIAKERLIESVVRRRESGGNLGGRPKTSVAKERLVHRLREEGNSYRNIRDQTGLAISTIRRIVLEKSRLN